MESVSTHENDTKKEHVTETAQHENVEKARHRRKVDTGNRLFQKAFAGILKNEKRNAPPFSIPSGTNLNSQKSESAEKPSSKTQNKPVVNPSERCSENSLNSKTTKNLCDDQKGINHQSKPIGHSKRHSENSRIHRNKSFNRADKYNPDFKKHPYIQDNCKKSSYEYSYGKKQNYLERKQSHESETEAIAQEEESEDYIEFSGVKHHREIATSNGGFKISFTNEEPSKSVSVLPVPNATLSTASTPTEFTRYSSPPTPKASSLPEAQEVYSFPSALPPSSPSAYSLPPLSPPSDRLENSSNVDCINVHKLLSAEKDCFIPPPVLPSTVNVNDSSDTSSERKKISSIFDDIQSAEDMSYPEENEVYHPVTDPEHLEAITNYILAVVKERSVPISLAFKVVSDLNLLFKNYFEGNVIDLYGSYDTDLAISTSDLNLVVMANVSLRKSVMFEIYKVLANELEKYHVHPFEEGISAHQTKINFSHPSTGINCQLAYLGKYKENIFKMGDFLKQMSREKRVKTLIIATKIWAECLAINEVEDGKLHPIGYTLLVIHFLQHCENPILPIHGASCDDEINKKTGGPNESSVGELWLAFLKYFSVFNWKQNVVTVNSKEIVSKKSKQWENYWMAIEDPFTNKNIASSVVNSDVADYIKACFKSSYSYFSSPQETISLSSSSGDCQNNRESPSCKYEFSFQQCIVDQSDALCDKCDEIDDICDECKKKIYVQPMASVPKMTDTFLSKIRKALMTVYNKYILSEEEINERKEFVRNLEYKVHRVYPDAEVKLFGSSNNGFGFKSSDLDICVTFKKQQINPIGVMKNIRLLLRKDKSFSRVVAIFGAQIPIIQFYYEAKKWRGDISLDNTLAVHNSELLYTYSLVDERCKILGCALKLLAKKALVAGVTEKALSSYSYLNMVIHFLQQVEPPVLPVLQDNRFREDLFGTFSLDHIVENCNIWFCKDLEYIKKVFKSENETPVEQLWLDLLDYYCSIDNNQFITIRQKETQYIKDIKRSSRLFNIQDPFIETKNLGCVVSSIKAQETKSVLNRARQLFRTPVKELPSSIKDIEDYFFSTMSLTGRIHKEAHCDLCGKFGHEQKDCKQSYFPLWRPNFRPFRKFNAYKNRSATIDRKPKNTPPYRKQFSLSKVPQTPDCHAGRVF